MDYIEQTEIIRQILETCLPKFWYSIGKPAECRLSIICEEDGIHIFIPERGKKTDEHIYTYWYDVIKNVAESVELRYAEKIINTAQEYL